MRRRVRVAASAVVLAVLATGCSDWTGVQNVEFDDPYIRQLEPPATGWLKRLGLYQRYGAMDRAFQLEAEGDYAGAIAEVERYLELRPEDVRVRAYGLSLLVRTDTVPPSTVGEEASRILEREPEFVPALLARGHARAELDRPGRAAGDLVAASRAPDVLPEDRAAALDDAARLTLEYAARLEAHGTSDAAAAYEAALELPLSTGQRVTALHGRARTAAADGAVATARATLDEAIALTPSTVALRRDAAELAGTDGDWSAAATHLEALLEIDGVARPQRADARKQLAAAYERLDRPVDAAAQLSALIELSSGDRRIAALHVRAADLLEAAVRPAEAARHLEDAAALTLTDDRTALLRRAARLYTDAGRYQLAVTALSGALARRPDDAGLRGQMSRVLSLAAGTNGSAGGPPSVTSGIQAAGLAGPELSAARRSFAEGYEAAGRLREAIDLYGLIVAAEEVGSPEWVHANERLAALHARRGEDRRSADRLMALHHGAGDRSESREGRWALTAADRYMAAGVWPEAAAAYRAALDRGALSGVDGARRLAVALIEAGDPAAAANAFRAIPQEQRSFQDLTHLASLALEAGDTVRAVARYRDALPVAISAADSALALRSVGYILLGSDDAAAVRALARAVELEPDASVGMDIARAYLRLGAPETALRYVEDPLAADAPRARRLHRLDLLAEIHAERRDTTAVIGVLEEAVDVEASPYRLNRLGFFYDLIGRFDRAAATFERAYEVRPSALQAAQVAYAYRVAGDEPRAVDWFHRSIDHGRERPDTALDFDAMRREVAALTDRLSAAFYSAFRGGGAETPGGAVGGVGQAGIASQGGVQLRYRPLAGRTPWGSDVDLFGRFFWGYTDGVQVDPDSYQGQLGIRYTPSFLPGSALGLERWIALGAAGLDTWALRLQLSRLLGRPYPDDDDGASVYASLYGDGAYLMNAGGGYLLFGEARPGVAIPVAANLAVLPHGTVSLYHQNLAGVDRSYLEGGPGLGLRLRVPRDGRYTRSFWTVELMTQYRWGTISGAGVSDDTYGELVLTLVIQL